MRINLVVLKTLRPTDLADFYGQIGVRFELHRHGTGPLHYAATLDNIVFEIYPLPKDKEKSDDTLRLGFTVDNLDDLLLKLRSVGGKIVKDANVTEWGYVAIIEDLDGRRIELTEDKK
jgi:lactoylglutathione lyase